ncbi:hypothetical protein AAC387_Pa03g0390 [Persea americana]
MDYPHPSSPTLLQGFSDQTSVTRFNLAFVYHRLEKPPPEDGPPPDPPPTNGSTTTHTLRCSSRNSRLPDWYGFTHTSLMTTLSSISIPSSYLQAVQQNCWNQAIKEELDALDQNHTCDIVECPSAVKLIGCKWIYWIKLKSDGSLDRHKARLVALRNRQEYGIDYEETFALVAKMTSFRLLLVIAAFKSWHLYQMDVTNAFLHGDLQEEVYMWIPQGVPSPSKRSVCRLRKSLYGLKQAPQAWFETFKGRLCESGFTQSPSDPSLFLCHTSTGVTVLLVYIDDIIIIGTDDDLIELADLHDSSPVDTLIEVNLKLSKDDGYLLPDPHTYRRLVGSLVYLTITRPDISYAVHLVSQFMTAPRHLHLTAVKRIIRYLLKTIPRGLHYPKDNRLHLTTYTDADWAGCQDTRRSTIGWCMYLGTSLVYWKCKKQEWVSRSFTEAEYRALSSAYSEILWLQGLLSEFEFAQTSSTPLHANNTGGIQITENLVFHERTKHIEVDRHFIRDEYKRDVISLPHVPTEFWFCRYLYEGTFSASTSIFCLQITAL